MGNKSPQFPEKSPDPIVLPASRGGGMECSQGKSISSPSSLGDPLERPPEGCDHELQAPCSPWQLYQRFCSGESHRKSGSHNSGQDPMVLHGDAGDFEGDSWLRDEKLVSPGRPGVLCGCTDVSHPHSL